MRLAHREGQTEAVEMIRMQQDNQFALEIDHMASCVAQNRMPHTPGQEGVQDHLLMEALYRSAETGAAVSLAPVAPHDATRGAPPEKS